MTKRRLGLALVMFVVLATIAQADEHAGNLLDNGSFETLKDGQPAAWLTGAQPGGSAVASVRTDRQKEGKNALRIVSNPNCQWAAAISDKIPIKKDKTYTLTGYAQVLKGTAIIKFDYFKDGQHLNQTIGPILQPMDGQWQKSIVRSETGLYPQATHIVATVAILGEAESYFDDIVMTAQ